MQDEPPPTHQIDRESDNVHKVTIVFLLHFFNGCNGGDGNTLRAWLPVGHTVPDTALTRTDRGASLYGAWITSSGSSWFDGAADIFQSSPGSSSSSLYHGDSSNPVEKLLFYATWFVDLLNKILQRGLFTLFTHLNGASDSFPGENHGIRLGSAWWRSASDVDSACVSWSIEIWHNASWAAGMWWTKGHKVIR